MAKKFKESGDTVIMTARGVDKLNAACEEVGGDLAFGMDVTLPADWEKAFATIKEKYGRLDVLINNAGGGITIKEVTEFSIDEIDRTIKLNLNSVIYGCRIFAPMMKEQKSGTIINISSVCARQAWPTWGVYGSAKAGLLNFSKSLYLELQPYGVRVSTLIPAAANTGFSDACGIKTGELKLSADDIADTALYIANLPQRAVVEDVTVWGIDQVVNPL
jgi:NADP-dependent 3-hydroxy acid dehydrogenase YdfG